jgi:hypothetical protein
VRDKRDIQNIARYLMLEAQSIRCFFKLLVRQQVYFYSFDRMTRLLYLRALYLVNNEEDFRQSLAAILFPNQGF